jgi:4-amino-4-deoxy-L-arabinose transferase-like glycosyltransferase
MFLWLLICNQWRRLRPLYLPSGVTLFLAIAAPWHVLAAERNPGWAQFYFVREHWQRFASDEHLRSEPFWFFLPVAALGLFPWVGFLGGAVRWALAGGWARRQANADGWFLVTWAAFVLLFFSQSRSKLIPYILPMFPPLAVLIGGWLARCHAANTGPRLRGGFRIFGFACGVLAMAVLTAVMKPGIIRDAEQAGTLRPFGLAIGILLLLGGVAAPWAARVRGVTAGVGTILGTCTGFFLVLLLAAPALQRAGTKELARVARHQMAPADRVYHYWAFFHDFVYYTGRPVGLVSYSDELEVEFMDPAERAARLIDDDELRRQWAGPDRVWLVVRKRDLRHAASVFADPAFRYHLIAATPAHNLLSNRP